MKPFRVFFYIILILLSITAWCLPPELSDKDLTTMPPRIIRVCCAFGSDLQLVGVPFVKINHITSIDKIGPHKFLGTGEEKNGIIYTRNGGFIDMGHLRDQADWTAFLYALILKQRGMGEFNTRLGYEGGDKTLSIHVTSDQDSLDCLLLAGKIAFDLSLWHELSTWFGASAIPIMPERYSSFSVEDVYSNLLGVHIGMEALKSNFPFEEAMTEILATTFNSLGAVESEEETYMAFDEVRNIWWTNNKRLPNKNVLKMRDTDVFPHCSPWLVPGRLEANVVPRVLDVPTLNTKEQLLTGFYKLSIDLNYKFPMKELFPDRETRLISQDDFQMLLNHISFNLNEQASSTDSNTTNHLAKSNKNQL